MLGLQGEWATRTDGVRVRVADVHPGDVLEVRAGERIPVDGIVLGQAVYVDESALTGEPLPVVRRAPDWVRSGGLVVDGSLTFEVRRSGADSCLARVARMVAEATTRLPAWQRLADRLAARFVAVVLLVSESALLLWWSAGAEKAVTVALSVLIITCPCALGLATPLAVAVAAGRAADRGLVVRGGEVWEKLERVTCVVFDKTGTLTEGRPQVRRLSLAPGVELREALTLAHSLERMSTHPLARAVAARAQAEGAPAWPCRDFHVLPGVGVEGRVEGRLVQLGRLGMGSGVQLWVDGGHWATFELEDRLRSEAASLVEELRGRGLRLVLLTGDAAEPAYRIGAQAGLRPEEIEAELDPAGKLARIGALQSEGERVLMLGDGLNDAPALKLADVGVAVAGSSELALDSADVLFLRAGLSPLRDLLRLGERTLAVLRGNFRVSLGYNLLALPAAVAGLVAPLVAAIAMPCSSLLVLANSLRLRRS
jgi:heavy metal translocating P-type ATPase